MSRSRFGGFFKNKLRIINNWNEVKSPSSNTTNAPASIQEFSYTDAQGIWGLRSTTQFPKSQIPPALYEFTEFTFLSIVSPGSRLGPTLSQIQAAYSNEIWVDDYLTSNTRGYQRWTVPATTTYTIEAGGAMGGTGGGYSSQQTISNHVYGAKIIGEFELTKGDVLEIVVGVKGGSAGGAHGNENGGGGGTFIKNITTDTLLLVAGGAGGNPSSIYGTSCTRSVVNGQGQSGNAVASFTCSSLVSAPSNGQGGNSAGSRQGGAGGGYLSNGANGGSHCSQAQGGEGYNAGLEGGTGNTCYDPDCAGGFGGGGGGMLGGPGAGGGYTGGCSAGQWSSRSTYGGGGGSYNIGLNQTNTAGGNNSNTGGYVGAGYCKITKES